MSVILNNQEVLALRAALDRHMPELRCAMARGKVEGRRDDLIELEQALSTLRHRLDAAELPNHVKGLT